MHINQQSLLNGERASKTSAHHILSPTRGIKKAITQLGSSSRCKIKEECAAQIDRTELCTTERQRPTSHCRPGSSSAEFGASSRNALACSEPSSIVCSAEDGKQAGLFDLRGSSPLSNQPAGFLPSVEHNRGRSPPLFHGIVPASAQTSPKRTFTTTNSGNESHPDDTSASSSASHKRQKLSAKTARAFACPFYKHDPIQYNPQNSDSQLARRFRTCSGPGWDSTHRLKEHLRRAHETELEQASMEVQQHLKRKSRGSTEEKRWTTIYLMLFPNAKDLPSPYYLEPAVPPDVAAQSLAYHLYNDLPDRILREISEHHGSDNALYIRGKLVNRVVRKSLSSGYRYWLHKQDWPISKPSTAPVDTNLDKRRWKSDYSESEIKNSPPERCGLVDKHDVKQILPRGPDPERPMSTISATGRTEFVLLQTKLCANWHLLQHQQIPSLKVVDQNAKDLFSYSSPCPTNLWSRISSITTNNCEGSKTRNFFHRLPEMRDDQGLWYKFYLAVVMLKRNESIVGWRLAEEGCKITKSVLEHPSRSFFPNLYNHFGSHKWDEFESLRLHILRYLTDVSVLLLGANHPLTRILGHLAIEGFLKVVSGPALKVMLDVYEQALGSMHPDVIQTERGLCKVLRRQNEFCAATDRVKAMLKHSQQANGRYHTNTRRCIRRLGHLYRYQERYEDAEQMYQDVMQFAESGSDNPGGLDDLALCTAHDLVSIAFQADRFETAESWARLAITAVADSRNITPENYLVCVLDLHKCLLEQGRDSEARDWMERYSEISNIPPQDSCEEHALLSSISKDHFAWVLAELGHPYLLPDAY
jgi:hypothetical protein